MINDVRTNLVSAVLLWVDILSTASLSISTLWINLLFPRWLRVNDNLLFSRMVLSSLTLHGAALSRLVFFASTSHWWIFWIHLYVSIFWWASLLQIACLVWPLWTDLCLAPVWVGWFLHGSSFSGLNCRQCFPYGWTLVLWFGPQRLRSPTCSLWFTPCSFGATFHGERPYLPWLCVDWFSMGWPSRDRSFADWSRGSTSWSSILEELIFVIRLPEHCSRFFFWGWYLHQSTFLASITSALGNDLVQMCFLGLILEAAHLG